MSGDEMRETRLREGALKLPSVMMQGITHIAPAVGLILLGAMKRAGREAWLLKAGHVAYEK